MAESLYQMLNGGMGAPQPQPAPAPMSGMRFANPLQKAQYIMQAMQNPSAFVRQVFPNMPPQISGNPMQVLNWMQQTQGVTQQQIQEAQQMAAQMPFQGQGAVR